MASETNKQLPREEFMNEVQKYPSLHDKFNSDSRINTKNNMRGRHLVICSTYQPGRQKISIKVYEPATVDG